MNFKKERKEWIEEMYNWKNEIEFLQNKRGDWSIWKVIQVIYFCFSFCVENNVRWEIFGDEKESDSNRFKKRPSNGTIGIKS